MSNNAVCKYLGDVEKMISSHNNCNANLARQDFIRQAVENKEAIVSECGALTTWTPPESNGRSPKDTMIVKRNESEADIDWDSPNNIPVNPELFEELLADALEVFSKKEQIYITNRSLGADQSYALPVRTITDKALVSVFTDNMFRPVLPEIKNSIFAKREFNLLVLPYDKICAEKYKGRLREKEPGVTSDMAIIMDFDNHIGLVYGSAYCGSVKKLMFTAMNYYLPAEGILPLYCSANEGKNGDSALLLGLSGTGKTTLSADPDRALLGDDEHGWADTGIANFENGCYAKLIDLSSEKEPEIFKAVFHKDDYLNHGSIVENAMMYPDGEFDLCDKRLTQNSRGSYPLEFLSNIKPSSCSGHPSTILFLTADANAVLPPIAKLNSKQAMLWFLMGYTSKLAGTETGVKDPQTTFSRFFGEPFMPRNPHVYADMLGEKMKKFNTDVYLVNTGWSGGPYGIGKRMDITLTRSLVNAALEGKLHDVEYETDPIFHIQIPKECPGVKPHILKPINSWDNKEDYAKRAKRLAQQFCDHFDKAYGNKDLDEQIAKQCPGK